MKKTIVIVSILIIILVYLIYMVSKYFGAGTIGKIKGYELNITKNEFEKRYNDVLKNSNVDSVNYKDYFQITFPKIKNSENEMLEEDLLRFGQKFFYISISENKYKYIFRLDTFTYTKKLHLNLISANKFGEPLNIADSISSSDKTLYISIFEKNFMDYIRNEYFLDLDIK